MGVILTAVAAFPFAHFTFADISFEVGIVGLRIVGLDVILSNPAIGVT